MNQDDDEVLEEVSDQVSSEIPASTDVADDLHEDLILEGTEDHSETLLEKMEVAVEEDPTLAKTLEKKDPEATIVEDLLPTEDSELDPLIVEESEDSFGSSFSSDDDNE